MISYIVRHLIEVELELERTTMVELMELLEGVEALVLSRLRIQRVFPIVILLSFFWISQDGSSRIEATSD